MMDSEEAPSAPEQSSAASPPQSGGDKSSSDLLNATTDLPRHEVERLLSKATGRPRTDNCNSNARIGVARRRNSKRLQGLHWADTDAGPNLRLNFDPLRDRKRIFQINAEIPHCAVHLGMTKQQLYCT